jgi:hypothetical protein
VIDEDDSVVAIVVAAVPTLSGSLAQALVPALLFASPEYAACQKKEPALGNVVVAEFGTVPPVTVTVAGIGCTDACVVHVLLVNTV